MESDTNALNDYLEAVNNKISPEEASETYLKNVSSTLQGYIKETDIASASAEDFSIYAKQAPIAV